MVRITKKIVTIQPIDKYIFSATTNKDITCHIYTCLKRTLFYCFSTSVAGKATSTQTLFTLFRTDKKLQLNIFHKSYLCLQYLLLFRQ